jgi:hypothetical protein
MSSFFGLCFVLKKAFDSGDFVFNVHSCGSGARILLSMEER